jgi:hypothetical protein
MTDFSGKKFVKFPSLAFTVRPSALELGVFLYLYYLKNRDYKVCMTYSLLSKRTSLSRGAILRAIKSLEEKGLLSVVKRHFRYRNTFSHRNCYHLIAPASGDPDLPVKEIVNLPVGPKEKGVLLLITYLAGEEGDTFMTREEVLSHFRPKPYHSMMILCDKGYVEISRVGVRLSISL